MQLYKKAILRKFGVICMITSSTFTTLFYRRGNRTEGGSNPFQDNFDKCFFPIILTLCYNLHVSIVWQAVKSLRHGPRWWK